MPKCLKPVLDDIKSRIPHVKNDEKIIDDIFHLTDIFSNKVMANSISQKDFFDTLKSISRSANSPKSDPSSVLKKAMNSYMVEATKNPSEYLDCPEHIYRITSTLLRFNLVDVNDLKKTGFFSNFPVQELIGFSKSGIISKQDIIDMLGEEKYKEAIIDAQESLLYWQTQRKDNSSNYTEKEIKENIRKYDRVFSTLTSIPGNDRFLLDLYTSGELEESFFEKICERISIDSLSREQIIALFHSKCGSKISTSSEKLLDLYGTKLSGEDCISLARIDRIDSYRLIDIDSIESVRKTSSDLAVDPHMLLDFYTSDDAEKLRKLIKKQYKYPFTDFSERFHKLVDKCEDDVGKEILYAGIVSSIRKHHKDNYESELDAFYRVGILPPESLKGFISLPYIEEMYSKDLLHDENLIDFIKTNVITRKSCKDFLSDKEIVEKVVTGVFESDFLKELDPTATADILEEYYYDEKCPMDILMKSYLEYDILSTERLNELFELKKPEVDLSEFITKDSDKGKVKDLFTNYHISYEDLSVLLHKEIITQSEFDDIKQAIDKADFYRRLRETAKISLQSNDVNYSGNTSGRPTPGRELISKIDFDMEKKAFEDIFSTPRFGLEPMPYIESYNINTGRPTSLNNYTIIPIEKYGLVAFEKFEAENGLFVMPYQQADYFLHGHMDLFDPTVQMSSDPKYRSKKTLYEMDSVKRVQHSKHFWRNMIESVIELSEEARQDLKPDGKYNPVVQKYIDGMKNRYIENSKGIRE